MHIVIWIFQGLLAFAFFAAGMMKVVTPKPVLIEKLGDWVTKVPGEGLKVIGVLEVLGALGMILPMALAILPILTPLAAIGLALTMVGAIILHANRKEYSKLAPNFILLTLAVCVILGRLVLMPVI